MWGDEPLFFSVRMNFIPAAKKRMIRKYISDHSCATRHIIMYLRSVGSFSKKNSFKRIVLKLIGILLIRLFEKHARHRYFVSKSFYADFLSPYSRDNYFSFQVQKDISINFF